MSHILDNEEFDNGDTLIFDNIHGYIEIDDVAKSIIDTPEFQRLRRIHQGGVMYYVFPTANHSRFEHSIGTYHLAKKLIINIKKRQPELGITNNIIKIVSIAGLCHDLGHLMYSHLFDDLFLPKLKNYKVFGKKAIHEERSIIILDHVIKKYNINITEGEFKVISDLINPKTSDYEKWEEEFKIGKWLFEIISNPKNNVDVDKFDYINRDNRAIGLKLDVDFSRLILQPRVINDEICYPIQAKENLYHLFFIRYQLHRRVYHHKTVKAIELMLVDLLFELEKSHKISEYLNDVEKMISLVDSFIFNTGNKKVNEILFKIETRQLPSLVFERMSLDPILFSDGVFDKFDENDYHKIDFKVGYTSGKNPNPLSKIKFYKPKNKNIIPGITIQNFSLLTNDNHQEYVCRVYCKNKEIKEELYHSLN
jgi:HD superfamily phosphohydrolase